MSLLFTIFIPFLFAFVSCNYDYTYKVINVSVPIDHFSFGEKGSFNLRVLINDSFWHEKFGPIFFYTGNEGDVELFAQNTGFLWEAAQNFDALIVFAEHRYYGQSMPFGNLSLEAPKYSGFLSSEQALADFVDVLDYIKKGRWKSESQGEIKRTEPDLNPVIAFGGSYGGMLSAWMRMKYPAMVEGALASSAPIWIFADMAPCGAFFEVTTSVYALASANCANNIRKSWSALNSLAKTKDGLNWLSNEWKLCHPLTSLNVKGLKNWLEDVYTDVAMTNYPYPTNFLMPLPANPVHEMCRRIGGKWDNDRDLLKGIFQGISLYFNGTGKSSCLKWDSDPSPKLGDRAWGIQSCTEMVIPECHNGRSDMFEPSEWNLTSFTAACQLTTGFTPNPDYAQKHYGGKEISASSNIIFSNGLLDPWSSGGVLYNVSATTVAIVIPDSAHHLDLRANNEHDPPAVKMARNYYKKIFKKWIRNYYKRHHHRDQTTKLFL